jgi:hypothetical protein
MMTKMQPRYCGMPSKAVRLGIVATPHESQMKMLRLQSDRVDGKRDRHARFPVADHNAEPVLCRKAQCRADIACSRSVQARIVAIPDHYWLPAESTLHKVRHTIADRDDLIRIGNETVLELVEEGTHTGAIARSPPLDRLDGAVEVVSIIEDSGTRPRGETGDDPMQLEGMQIIELRRLQ